MHQDIGFSAKFEALATTRESSDMGAKGDINVERQPIYSYI
jgi:hypothetical protein